MVRNATPVHPLSFPRELRNEIYEHLLPTIAHAKDCYNSRLACHQVKEELDEEIVRKAKRYYDLLAACVNNPEGPFYIQYHHIWMPSKAPQNFNETRIIHLVVDNCTRSLPTVIYEVNHGNPHNRKCIITSTTTGCKYCDNDARYLRDELERSLHLRTGISCLELLEPDGTRLVVSAARVSSLPMMLCSAWRKIRNQTPIPTFYKVRWRTYKTKALESGHWEPTKYCQHHRMPYWMDPTPW
jgi:hypothetical protein